MSASTPRREFTFACTIFLLNLCLFFVEVIFLGRTILPVAQVTSVLGSAVPWKYPELPTGDPYRPDKGASAWQIEPQTHLAVRALAGGHLPLWNSYQGFGAPLLANSISGVLDVTKLPLLVSQKPLAWDAYYLLRVFAGQLLMYAFAASLGLSLGARIFAATSYVFSGFMLMYGNNHFISVYLLVPALFLGIERLHAGKRATGVLVTSLAVAASMLVGMPESTLLAYLLACGYGAVVILSPAVVGRRWRQVVRPEARLLVASWLLGLGLSAPLLLPLAEYLTVAAHAHDPQLQIGLQHLPPRDLILGAIPLLHGLPTKSLLEKGYSGVASSGYFGSAVLLLACVGAWSLRGSALASPGYYFLAAAVLLEAKSFGVPVVNELGRLPGLNVTIIYKWGAPLIVFCLTMLGAIAIHHLTIPRAMSQRSVMLGGVTFAGLLGIALALGWPELTRLEQTHVFAMAGIAAWVALWIWVTLLVARPFVRPGRIAAVCCIAVAFELFLYAPHRVYAARYDPYTTPPFVDFLRTQASVGIPWRIFGRFGVLYPNTATVYGLEDIRSLDALYPDRYLKYVKTFLAEDVSDRYVGSWDSSEGSTRLVGNRWFDLTGVRFVLAPRGVTPATEIQIDDDYKPRIVPETLSPQREQADRQYRRVYSGEIDIYENLNAFPRAFLVQHVVAVDTPEQAIALMQAPTFDPALQAVVEGNLPARWADAGSAAVSNSTPPQIARLAADEIVVHVESTATAALLLTDIHFPGWVALVDGRPTTLYPADLAFRAVLLESGTHEVRFQYRPLSFSLGVAVWCVSSLLLLVLLVVLGLDTGRRRRLSTQ